MTWEEDMRKFTVENTIYALIGALSWLILPVQMMYTFFAGVGDYNARVTGIEVFVHRANGDT